ncbi:unnamed protein product [Gordionus sp. m RMFG-2023]
MSSYKILCLIFVTLVVTHSVNSQLANPQDINNLQKAIYQELKEQTEYITRYGIRAFCKAKCGEDSKLSRCGECPDYLKLRFPDRTQART